MLCWALEPRGLFSFMLHPFLQSLASYLLPVTSFVVALWGKVSVRMLWLTMTRMRTEGWRLVMPGWWFFCCFVPFPFQWLLRTAGVFFGSEQKIPEGCQILGTFTYFWSLQVNEAEESQVSGGCPSAVRSPVIWRQLWKQQFSATVGMGGRGV